MKLSEVVLSNREVKRKRLQVKGVLQMNKIKLMSKNSEIYSNYENLIIRIVIII